MVGVDRNTIVNQAPIAELNAVNSEKYNALRMKFTKRTTVSAFAELCYSFCVKEPEASLIEEHKNQGLLLDVTKK